MIININRSIIPACDVTLDEYREIVKATADIRKIGAYKVGISFLDVGLKAVVDSTREFSDKPVIYDHQKAGTDIPESTPSKFMDSMVRAGINAVILFPQAGPATEYEWINAAKDKGLGVIVGGEMTHARYLDGDSSESKKKNYTEIFRELGIERELTGYLRRSAPDDIYELAARMGVADFVVPGNKPDRIRHYKGLIEKCGVKEPVFYSPGLVAQGGEISEGAEAAGERFHAIVGRGIYQAQDKKKAALEMTCRL
ncbi:MAG: orotidine 5'-phosphate decarboxylase / HUMPS family protein [Candidatus Micrarchaeota archaeon]